MIQDFPKLVNDPGGVTPHAATTTLICQSYNSVLTSFRLKGSAKIRYLCNRNGQPQSNWICSINRLVVVCSKLSSKPINVAMIYYSIRSF